MMSRSNIKTRSKSKQDKQKRTNAINKLKLNNQTKIRPLRPKIATNSDLFESLLKGQIKQKNTRKKVQEKEADGVNNNQVMHNNNYSLIQSQIKEYASTKFIEDNNLIQTLKVTRSTANTITKQKKNKQVAPKKSNKVTRNTNIKNLKPYSIKKKHVNITNGSNTKDLTEHNIGWHSKVNITKNISKEQPPRKVILPDVAAKNNKKSTEQQQKMLSKGTKLCNFSCDNCDESFEVKEQIEKHMLKHMNQTQFNCIHCKKRFRRKSVLKIHVIKKHLDSPEPEKFTCDLCGKFFFLKENLSLHLTNHSQEECQCFCGRQFSCHSNISQHELYHLKFKLQCIKCKKKFKTYNSLKLHTQCKALTCKFCGKDFIRNNSLKTHVEKCQSGFKVKCPICNKKLKGHLTEHLRTHGNLKPHKCPECSKTFTQATQLNVHLRRHTGAKPFICPICKHSFTHSNAMLTHFRVHTRERPYQCPLCPQTFFQSPHMRTHMLTIHGKSDPYKCPNCNEFFKIKRDLQTHTHKCVIKREKVTTIEPPDSAMNLSRMRFLLALLMSMIVTESKLKCLGFNKRLIDDILIDALEALGYKPCKDPSMKDLKRLKINIEILLNGTIPKYKMRELIKAEKTTEDVLELLTDDMISCTKIFQSIEQP